MLLLINSCNKRGKKTATKTSNKFKIVPRIRTLLVLALQNFPFVIKQTKFPVFS